MAPAVPALSARRRQCPPRKVKHRRHNGKTLEKSGETVHSGLMKNRRILLLSALAFVAFIAPLAAQERPDALRYFRTGRDLEAAGRADDAAAAYRRSIEICRDDLAANSRNMDAYTIYGWALVRLNRHQEAVDLGLEALKISNDVRVIQTMGEAYFYLRNYRESLRQMERYVDAAPRGDRVSTAYFFIGEIYRIQGQFNKADIAYSQAVFLEPALPLWWFRLGSVREQVGDKPGARTAYERAIRLRPDYREATEGLARVRS